ncbi:hypothetical protein [Parasulfitobacter algicola]|uniref:Uncharacterized protein n=1 Tax=Parasulfitobacter algicola TaxID=2614809 RepID=A0ABX2J188_9RHOB|nr:hypothetical protein [Sulfitobacter algicola]NSX56998.1 hypothetical protein [Sulfitobacter algicola]
MSCLPWKAKSRAGFALVTVLFTLAILTVLLAVASERTMTRLQETSLDRQIALMGHTNRDALHLSIIDLINDQSPGFEGMLYQDVGGLIDLNTASPALLQRLFADITETTADRDDALRAYRTWRRQGRRLIRVDDLPRISGLPWSVITRLHQTATVHSGRTGISPDVAPLPVLEIVTGETGTQDQLAERVDPAFVSPPSNVNYLIYRDRNLIGGVNALRVGQPRILFIQ